MENLNNIAIFYPDAPSNGFFTTHLRRHRDGDITVEVALMNKEYPWEVLYDEKTTVPADIQTVVDSAYDLAVRINERHANDQPNLRVHRRASLSVEFLPTHQ